MPATPATVIVTYSRRMGLRLGTGDIVEARIKGKQLKAVCGDHVEAQPIPGESDWLITAIAPRNNELLRPNLRGKVEVLAANLDRIVVIAAVSPVTDWFIVDRYLCAAEIMGVAGAIVFNKTDQDVDDAVFAALATYADLGYVTLRCSAKSGDNIDQVADALRGQTAIFVGQSGVGKSSLINCLSDSVPQKTFEVSDKTGEGRHTTVNSRMISLVGGGAVIDSPGVRDYAPALQSPEQAKQGYREIYKLGANCRFANCRHLREPDCAVKDAVASGGMNQRRYESYKRMYVLTERLATG